MIWRIKGGTEMLRGIKEERKKKATDESGGNRTSRRREKGAREMEAILKLSVT